MVGSRLDYCNSLLYCTSNANIDKLQDTTNKPPYLAELLAVHKPPRVLRSSHTDRLHVDRHMTVFGCRAFRHAACLFGTTYHLNSPKPDITLQFPSLKNISRPIFTVNLYAADHVTHSICDLTHTVQI